MKTINIEDDVFQQLDQFAMGIFTHSDVIRKLLASAQIKTKSQTSIPPQPSEPGALTAYSQSAQFQSIRKTISRYLSLLGFAYKTRPQEFAKVELYQRGSRTYFAKTESAVTNSGAGAIHAKQIPGSPYWTLVTLDNRAKKNILTDILLLVGFAADDVKAATAELELIWE